MRVEEARQVDQRTEVIGRQDRTPALPTFGRQSTDDHHLHPARPNITLRQNERFATLVYPCGRAEPLKRWPADPDGRLRSHDQTLVELE